MKSKLLIYSLPVLLFAILLCGYGIQDHPNNIDQSSAKVYSQTNQDNLYLNDPTPDAVCNYTWTAQTSGTTNQLLTVSTVSSTVGWAAGVGPTVVRTTAGGIPWVAATGTGITGDIYNIYGIDALTALVTTSPAATFIYKTINGGTTWTQVYTLAGGFIDGIQMINTLDGYAVGDPVGGKWTILETHDGGNTWARMATEPTQVGTEAGWNNSFLIIGTDIWFGTSNTKVYHSPDLGVTWTSGATGAALNTYAVHYNSNFEGLAGGGPVATPLTYTNNGGATYSATATYPGTAGNLDGLEGNGLDWWAIRTDANIYRSINQGTTWTTAYTQAGAVFQDLDFTISGCASGWAVGNSGAIARMSNTSTPFSLTLTINFQACTSTDAINVELRSASSPYSIIETSSGLGGLGIPQAFSFSNASNATPYYIVVKHRNSIETWSKPGGEVFTGGALSYSFTSAATQAYGSNEVLVSGMYSIFTGDVNQDGYATLTDLIAIFIDVNNFVSGHVVTDLNCDETVDLTDLVLEYNNSSNFVSISRP